MSKNSEWDVSQQQPETRVRRACVFASKGQIVGPLTTFILQPGAAPHIPLGPWEGRMGSGCPDGPTFPFRPEQIFPDPAPLGLEGLSRLSQLPQNPTLSQVTRALLLGFPRMSVASPSPRDNYMLLGSLSSGTSQASTTPTLPFFKYKGCTFSLFLFKEIAS